MSLKGDLTQLGAGALRRASRKAARTAAIGISVGAVVIVLFCIGLVFVALGLFLALEVNLGAPGAALLTGVLTMLLALLIVAVAALAVRSRSRRLPPAHRPTVPPRQTATAAASGFLAGFLTGKSADKYPPRR